MNNNTYTCPKCNSEVNINSRCCMKCGYLNPYHVQNVKYEKYMNNTGSFTVTNGNVVDANSIKNDTNIKAVEMGFGNRMGNYTVCFIINLVCYIVLIGILVFFYFSNSDGTITGILSSNIYYALFLVTVFSLFLYSQQLIFMKMNRHWILSLIPLVNTYFLSDAISENKWLNLLVFVPGVNIIYGMVLLFRLGRAFNKSGLLTLLLPLIMFPVIGFGGSSFRGVNYIGNNDTLEKEFKHKKNYLKVAVLTIICSILMAIYANIVHIDQGIDRLSSTYIYFAAQKVMRMTKIRVENNTFKCDDDSEVIYFHFSDLNDYFSIPFYVFRDPIEGYVKAEKIDLDSFNSYYVYYISLTDGSYGFPETKFEDLKISSVVPYTFIQLDDSINSCYFS